MLISYDPVAKAIYISLAEAKSAKTVEFAPQTYLDFARSGRLIGVEMLSPNRPVLKRIARKYHHPELSRIHPEKFLKTVA
jgi:uncharacterized protein YuzE